MILIMLKVVDAGLYGFGSHFAVDALGLLTLLTVAVVGLAASFYSIGYMRTEVEKATPL